MTLYEDILKELSDCPRFFRFEGYRSYPFFRNHRSDDEYLETDSYIYFSNNFNHHLYYSDKRIRQYIKQDLLKHMDLKLDKKTLLDHKNFSEIEQIIEKTIPKEMVSISFINFELLEKLLENNSIVNRNKITKDKRIERVDSSKHSGGYGFSGEWLHVFEMLTYAYIYHRITRENLIEYLHILRRNMISSKKAISPTLFLERKNTAAIKINKNLFGQFAKYELMNSLQKILEEDLYFEDSYLGRKKELAVRECVLEYVEKTEKFQEILENKFKKYIKK